MGASDIEEFIFRLQKEIAKILSDNLIGFYLHGSASMGGFNPNSSDVDILAVTGHPVTVTAKRELAGLLLRHSHSPFPIEISFLNNGQLKELQHPCPFDFHYSEFWRDRYESDLLNGTSHFLHGDTMTDADLAAHITIVNSRGICVSGKPITEVFPVIPRADYLSSILNDFEDCLENIEVDPIYCTLNLIRVFWYVKEGVISSKQEAGQWGVSTFPEEIRPTIKKVVECYAGEKEFHHFEKRELTIFKNYIVDDSKLHGAFNK